MSELNRAERHLFDELREASPILRLAVILEIESRIGHRKSLERVVDALIAADKGRAIVSEALKAQEVDES